MNSICYPSSTHTTSILGNSTSQSISIKLQEEITKIQDSIDFFTKNTASIYDQKSNKIFPSLPIFLVFICNAGLNLNKKDLVLFDAPPPVVINKVCVVNKVFKEFVNGFTAETRL